MTSRKEIEVSVVMPCLNEEKTIGICIKKAKKAIKELKLNAEIVVSDNGSRDQSVKIAKSLGARVVHQPKRGYGNAYKKGFDEARGKYIVMGDSDNTYDFTDIGRFIMPLRQGYDMVMGTRLKGRIMPGAMPELHKYIGNPFLSWFLRLLFKTNISDAHCGMRSFTKQAYKRMHLKTTGMEFASEIVINAAKARLRIKEIPITLYASKGRRPHLSSLRDGWRHLRFMILYSPFHLFFVPGILFFTIGALLLFLLVALYPLHIGNITFGPNTAAFGSFFTIVGYNLIFSGYFAKVHYFKISYFDKPRGILKKIDALFNLERGLFIGGILLLGVLINIAVLIIWAGQGFGELRPIHSILSIVGLTVLIIGIQTIFNSFLLSILKMEKE